jgi:hypothetical protein
LSYRYVGPPDLLDQVRTDRAGRPIRAKADLLTWLDEQSAAEPFTYVVDMAGVLRLAPRRSEHVVCAAGGQVLAAGEITFDRSGDVTEISNQSTGYCPDLTSWQAVADALGQAGLRHPGGFTHEVVFRRCPECGEVNIVREGDYVCVFCEADLPVGWNVAG